MQAKITSAHLLGINHQMIDASAYDIIKSLHKNGYHGYVVGGGVRDLLLNVKPKDFDIATDATPEQVKRIFQRNSMIIGRRFKIVHIYYDKLNEARSEKLNKKFYDRQIIEVSTFRSSKAHNLEKNDHGRITADNSYGTMDEDAFRRDFTINALYYDPISEKIYDYHNGIQDIISKKLTIIGKPQTRYIEDPVRIIRAIRIAAKLDLEIDINTIAPFKNLRHLLANEPRGRLFEEMNKILLSGNAAQVISELDHLGIPRKVFPLFTQVFFENKNEFAQKIIERTDTRIKNHEDVSLIFIYAAVFWQSFITHVKHYQESFNMNIHDAYNESFYALRQNFITNGLTQHLISNIRDIWMLQLSFEHPVAKKIEIMATHRRFRQAWNLVMIRHDFKEINEDVYQWWDSYINDESADKTGLLIELIDKFPQPENKQKKKRRKKRKKKKHSPIENS